MTELFIDNKLAVIPDKTSFKLTTENPYFTKSSTYTYDVELPLNVAQNRVIFGWVDRMDMAKGSRSMDARLVVDNVTVLAGTAHITSIDESSVKVQLLGESASFNYGNKMDDTYIDEMDLGDWYWTTFPDGSYWTVGRRDEGYVKMFYDPSKKFQGTTDPVLCRANFSEDGTYDRTSRYAIARIWRGDFPWVAFPVNNSSADFICNGYSFQLNTEKTDHRLMFRGYVGERKTAYKETDDLPVMSFAIQPYVWLMAEKVAKASGFELSREDNALYTDPFFKKIFIVNAGNYVECSKCLPHWSVNEWWSQIENTFGLVMGVDYGTKKLTLRKRCEHYAQADVVTLSDIVDEYTSEVDDESESDISSSNIGFADADLGKEDFLSEFIVNTAETNEEFNSITDLLAWAKTQGVASMTAMKGTIFKCADGRHFIYSSTNNTLVEVNMFRPRIVNKKKEGVDIELKFVPARFVEQEIDIYPYFAHTPDGTITPDLPVGSVPFMMLQAPGPDEMDWYKNNNYLDLDIDAIINEEADEGSSKANSEDVIYLAIADFENIDSKTVAVKLADGSTYTGQFDHPRPFLRARVTASLSGNPVTEDAGYSLGLNLIDGQTNIGNKTIGADTTRIVATVRQCIKFVAETIPDPGSIFIIHNKRFVCEKIEADINSYGLRRLLTGYFYEVDL